jgi:hypothetical protein
MEVVTNYVSWSEIRTFLTCRKRWEWNYEKKLVTKKPHVTPFFGSLGHEGLAEWYKTGSIEKAKKAVKEYLEENYIKSQELFDEDIEVFRGMAEDVCTILERYIEFYGESDFPLDSIVLVEHKFEIPIRAIKTKLIGYWDLLHRDKQDNLWLVEHKFPKTFQSEEDIVLNGQIGTYQWAALRLKYNIVGTIYNQISQRLPAEPEIKKDGKLSIKECYCDWDSFEAALRENGQDPDDLCKMTNKKGEGADVTYREEMMPKLAEKKFFDRFTLYRPKKEVTNFARNLEHAIWDMTKKKKHIYMSSGPMTCNSCAYKELCIEELKGGDVDWLIENVYEKKKSRRKTAAEEAIDAEIES